ncbi:hypothetical protein KXQ82_11730 [Mucilaginibacter sp. HMF5004]|uniref:hypothetical protein n=1 Tax=Mucilaginibacter rivuli TaxID=2857527 RepID=UPI001C5E84F1|nr:hypothetical protein [Mucilaginibacter rivuli]MBW4890395.1 hypothetical protein [Mucilaginibacter rivuli]
MKKLKLLAIAILLFSAVKTNAQTDTATTTKAIFFNAGAQYMSNLTYAGRRDESSVPVLLPNFTVISKKGFFVSAMGYFDLSGSKSQSEGLSVTPGYVFSFDKKKEFGGAVSVTKYFITSNSPIILSSFNFTADAQLNYNPADIIKMTLGASYRIGKDNSNDIINNAELSKEIWIVKTGTNKKDGLKVDPTATLYAGTQSFYQTYYTESQVQRAVANPSPSNPLNVLFPSQPSQSIVTQTVTQQRQEEVKKYNLLAISGSIPVTYAINKVQLSFTPYFIKPLNQVDYTTNNAMNGVYFLFTTGVSITF